MKIGTDGVQILGGHGFTGKLIGIAALVVIAGALVRARRASTEIA